MSLMGCNKKEIKNRIFKAYFFLCELLSVVELLHPKGSKA